MKRSILFVSTNSYWGGSETLWSETALLLAERGYQIQFAVRYKGAVTQKLQAKGAFYIDLSSIDHPSLSQKILRKVNLELHPFAAALAKTKPGLVVISQGNNVDGNYYMSVCRQQGIPYLTITQLVTDILWTFLKDEDINELRMGYASAVVNYFVSKANLRMHRAMIGEEQPNSSIVLNPFAVPVEVLDSYPPPVNGQYNIALVGRLECFHKGHDLLLQVLAQPKWKERQVTFNFFGEGPHRLLLERLVKMYDISNVIFKGHIHNVAEVWSSHHLLILPSRMEGQSLALIEAMWCYRGFVATDVGGASELVTDGVEGFIAPTATVTAIDEALERAWCLREQWEEIGKEAGRKIRELYKTHPIESFAGEIEKVSWQGTKYKKQLQE